jgi:hypothetical protein
MGVVIYGRRAYGRVHQHEGEYADTQFAHIDFVPLFPLGSFWVTQDLGNGQRLGFPIKLNGKSVAATYLRIWGPLLAIILLATTKSFAGTMAGALVAAASVWAWTWRSRRGDLALRRSDFDRVALGSRCDPAWMTADMRERIAKSLETSLSKREDARPPDDVARFGAKDVQEAVLAYGILRTAKHREARSAADRLLSSAFEQLPSDGGPYREGIANAVPELGAAISAAARAHAEAARARRPVVRRWFHNKWLQLVGLVLISTGAAGIAGTNLRSTLSVDAKQLGGVHPPTGRAVRVQCDRIQNTGWEVMHGDDIDERITMCWMGTHVLPVVTKDDSDLATTTVEGKLRDISLASQRDQPWVDALHQDSDLDAHSYEVYLVRDASDRKFDLVFGSVYVGLVALGWFFWIRARLRSRRARAHTATT